MKAYTMQVILMLLLLQRSLQECQQGCLKCSSDNECEYCDYTQNYYLKDGSCQLGQIDNCETYDVEGQCLLCEPQYYLDKVTNQCLLVTEGVRIDNCTYYETENACMICESSFYLNSLNCQAVTVTIDNCKMYSAIDKCGECVEGYIVQHDQKGCLEEKTVQNCQTFTTVRCNNCQDDYYLQKNYWNVWIKHLLQTNLARKEERALEASIATKVTTSNNCTSVVPQNCAQLKDFKTCHICKQGYFLKENDCVENPPLSIPYCEDYSQEDRCKKCEQGYRLTPAPDYKCKAVENVQFCINFDGAAFETRCLECKERYYLKFDNLCEERTITVEFCLEHEVDKDQCAKCETHYQLTTDGKKCLPETPSCKSYLESDINTEKLICEECNEYHYLNIENLCTLGTTENCRIFERIYDQCRLCEDNYFLNADLQCEQHPLIDGCTKYDPYIKNKCVECNFDRFLLTLQTECQQVQVDNCRVHKTIDHCAECDQGYTLLNNGQCEELDPDLNCLVGQYGLCIKCQDGYTIEQGLCIVQLIYEKDVCQLSEMPIDYKSALQCTSKEDLVRLGLDENTFDNGNCKAFEYDEDFNYKCIRCEDNFVPDQTGACVATSSNPECNDDTTFFYRSLNYKLKKEQENLVYVQDDVCLRIAKNDPAEVNHCKEYGISKGQFNENKKVQYGCLACQDATTPERQFQMVDPSSNRETLYKDSTNIFWKTDFTCDLKNSAAGDFTDLIWGDVVNIDNCEYFQELQHDKVGCMRCKNGFSGVIKNPSIDRCIEYDPVNLQCTKCQENYLLEANQKECNYVTNLTTARTYATNCELESFDEQKCYLCKPGYTLKDDGSECLQNTSGYPISNCAAHTHNSESAIVATCERCDDGYSLSADKQNCWQVANCKVPASASTCTECDLTYELVTGNTCTQVSNCDYNELNSGDCLVNDTYNISTLNQCTSVTVTGCTEYDQVNAVCTKCENGKYLFADENTGGTKLAECVAEESFPSSTILPGVTHAAIEDCKIFGIIDDAQAYNTAARYGCLECKANYYFFDPSQKGLNDYNCIQNSYVDKNDDNTDTNTLLLTEFVNNTNCDLYDFLQDECSECKSGTAYWSSDYCCPLTEYYDGSSCVSISLTDYPDCDQLELVENQGYYECQNCATPATNELVDGFCKAKTDTCDHVSYGDCIVKSTLDCTTFDIRQNECTTCAGSHYTVPADRKNCCDDSSFEKSDGTCATLSSDLSIPDDSDKEANLKASCIQYDDKSKICLKCATGKTFTGRICVDTDDLYDNCAKIDSKTNLCEMCDSGYHLNEFGACCSISGNTFFDVANGICTAITPANSVDDCIVYSQDAADSCDTCKEGFWNHSNKACCKHGEYLHAPSADSGDCQYPSDNYQYCLLYEFESSPKQQYKCQLCNPNFASQLTNNSVETCCPHGKIPNTTTGDCEADTTCKIHKTTTTCNACGIDKQLISDETCIAPISECDVATDASQCTQCNYDQIVDSNDTNVCETLVGVNVMGKYNCQTYDSTNGNTPLDCTSCLDSIQIESSEANSCCPIGTYHSSNNLCLKIPIENCAVYNSTDDKCTKCFQDDDQCVVSYDFVSDMGANLKLRYLHKVGYDDIRSSINEKYYLGNDAKQHCCKYGYYYNGSSCVEIPTQNCQEYDYQKNQCKECKNDYLLYGKVCKKLDPSQCSQKNGTTTYYNSNGHCCPQNKYWNVEEELCEDIPDSNCKESDDGVVCKECDTGKSPQSYVKVQYQLHYRATIDNCPHIHKHKSFYKCVPDADKTSYDGYTELKEFEQIAENCKDVDYTNKKCNECLDGFYRPEGVNICCANGKVAVEVEGQHFCRDVQTIDDNCVNFDAKTNKCLECIACNSDYLQGTSDNCQLSGGVCCQRFEHFNIMTGQCENMLLGDCQDVDLEAKMCRQCPDGYYFYHSGCVKEGYSFTNLTMTAVKSETVSGNGSVCLQKSPQGHCAVCDVNPGGGSNFYYNYKGICVKQKTNDLNDAAISGVGFVDTTTTSTVVCLELDSYDNCTKCLSGYFLIEGRCCKNNEYWSGSACVAPTPDCDTADPTLSSEICIECTSPNVLLTIQKTSAPATQAAVCNASILDQLNQNLIWGNAAIDAVAENVALAQIQSTINCVVFQDGKCSKCATGFVLAEITIDVKISGAADNRKFTRCIQGSEIPNCLYYNASDITQCLYCDGTKKLNSNECTGNAIQHCLKSDANGCLECEANYLIYTESDWSSGSEVLNKKCWFNKQAPCNELEGNTLTCKSCAANYSLDFHRTKCDQDLSDLQTAVGNCISGVSTAFNNSTFDCFICEKDYYLADAQTCTAVTGGSEVDLCKVYDSATTCSECSTGYYATNEGLKCCANGTIFYEDDCVDWKNLSKDNCTKVKIQTSTTDHIEKVQCQECATGYQLTNGLCCPNNSIGMERFCYTPTSTRSANCKILDNIGRCNECESTHYLTNGGCCVEGQYFNTAIEQCQSIGDDYLVTSASQSTVDCLRVSDQNECTKCSNSGRLYQGICYDSGHSIEPYELSSATTTATNEYFPKCSEVVDKVCTKCDSSYSLGGSKSSDKCCGKNGENYYYDEDEQRCKSITTNCTAFDHNTNTCTQCDTSYYSTGLWCCQANEYFNTSTNACENISTLTGDFKDNCQELTEQDNLSKKCSQCASNYSLNDGICYKNDAITDNCSNKSGVDCLTCSSTNIISGLEVSVCCPDNQIFDTATKSCQTSSGLANCKNQLNATLCSECDTEYYLLNHDTCCDVGKKPNGASCEATVSIENCVEWGTLDGDDICLTCKTGFTPYNYKKNGDYTSKCCADGTFLDPVSELCMTRDALTNSAACDKYDVFFEASYYRLPRCVDVPSSHYISNGFICPDGKEFIEASSSCVDINATAHPNCNQVSDDKCLNCTSGYLISGKCCPDGEFSDGSAACAASTSNGLSTCKYFYEECPEEQFGFDCTSFTIGNACKECNTSHYLLYNYKCCPDGEYWDKDDEECKDYTSANVGDDHKSNIETNCTQFGKDFECLNCANSTVITDDGKNCCATTSDFVDIAGACSDTYTILTSCQKYDHTKYECLICSDGYYLTLGKCCADGEYYERSSNLCKTINTTTLNIDAQCNQYDEFEKCLGCGTGYEINFDQECVAVPTGCDQFDANTFVCDSCQDGYSLSEDGNCCPTDQMDSYGVCKNIETQLQINNCEEYFQGKCSQCQTGHYLIQGECCPHETYYDRTSSSDPPCTAYSSSDYNNVSNCKEYGYAKEFCDVCKDGYLLVRYLWGDKCVDLEPSSTEQITNCVKYENTFDAGTTTEQVRCTQCSFAVGSIYKLEDLATATTATDILPELKKALVTECEVYHITNQFASSTFACIKCSDNFYLNKKNECTARSATNVAQCVGNKPLDKDECDQCASGYFVNYLKQCEQIAMEDCIHYDREKELCLKCSDAKDVAATTSYDQTTHDADTDYRQMRLKYFKVNDYVRSKCSLEKHTPETFPDHYLGYIDSCTADADQTDKLAINLDNFYDKWYPFNFCSTTGEIPIAFVKAGKDQTGMPYGLGNYSNIDLTSNTTLDLDDVDGQIAASLTFDKTSNFGKSTHCIATYGDTLGGLTDDPKSVPIANCAMVMTNVEMPFETTQGTLPNPDFSTLSTFCTACQTGYAPVRNPFLPIVINSCNVIANCDTSDTTAPKVLNGCPKCTKDTATPANNYTFKINEDGIVDYTECVQTDDINCELLNQDDTCKYCKDGYLPNYDGKCAQYRAPNCDDAQFSFQKGFTVDNFEYVLAYLGTAKGCNDCATGYKGLLIETKKLVCSQSTTLETQDFETDSPIYDTRCEQYGIVNDKAVCTLCAPGYLLDQNRKCLLTSLENCTIAEDATKCAQCSGDFILENGNCVQQVIENCNKHNINNAGDPICVECEETYLLKNDICVKGPIDNCRNYNDIPICISCVDNFVLVTLKDGSQQCSAINQEIHPNCVQYKSQSFNDNQVECIQCSTLEFLPVYYEIDQDICLQLEIIDNCIRYDKEPLFVHSSLKCLECEQKYVLQNDKCEERKVTVEHCTEYSKYEHKCTECSNGYYISADGIQCILEPSGIPNCDVYADYELCKHCKDHTYLYKNECIQVPSQIEHCKYYKDSQNCALCSDGYILENNQCKEYEVTCQTYLSSTECATCPEGQGIKYENDKRICALFNVVQYCDVHDQIEPYKCKKCISGYFLYDELPRNKCVRAITPIGNCVEYSGPEDCSLCADGYLLSFDQRSCIEKTFNDNCASRSEVQPYCVQCQSGYILNNNDECVEDTSSLPEGCLGLDKSGVCHICRIGYYQNSEKKCIKL